MIAALADSGRLSDIDAVLTGYMPSKDLVEVAARAIAAVKAASPQAHVMVDPVLGDDPFGLYIDARAASAVRDVLVPIADIITPNRFELAFLTGCQVTSVTETVAACRHLQSMTLLATSVPIDARSIGNLCVEGGRACLAKVARRPHAPHGTGDLIAAVMLAGLLSGKLPRSAFASAVSCVVNAIEVSNSAHDVALEKLDWHSDSYKSVELTDVDL